MLSGRIKRRVPSATVAQQATLDGHRLTFSKISSDESGKCHIVKSESANDKVEGVVFEINKDEAEKLDAFEKGYSKKTVKVLTPSGTHDVITYVGDKTNDRLIPYHWYKELVLAGANEHKLPSDYIAKLNEVVSKQDDDEKRRLKNEAILKSSQVKTL
jgi:gamma-glutamylcyclotransferase (GGCT)/AIG2-like uncharacterized protein YtfP